MCVTPSPLRRARHAMQPAAGDDSLCAWAHHQSTVRRAPCRPVLQWPVDLAAQTDLVCIARQGAHPNWAAGADSWSPVSRTPWTPRLCRAQGPAAHPARCHRRPRARPAGACHPCCSAAVHLPRAGSVILDLPTCRQMPWGLPDRPAAGGVHPGGQPDIWQGRRPGHQQQGSCAGVAQRMPRPAGPSTAAPGALARPHHHPAGPAAAAVGPGVQLRRPAAQAQTGMHQDGDAAAGTPAALAPLAATQTYAACSPPPAGMSQHSHAAPAQGTGGHSCQQASAGAHPQRACGEASQAEDTIECSDAGRAASTTVGSPDGAARVTDSASTPTACLAEGARCQAALQVRCWRSKPGRRVHVDPACGCRCLLMENGVE